MPYTSQADIPKGAGIALANPGMAQMTGGQGLQAIGQSISKIAESQMNIRISREIAEGMAERNALISQYKLDLMKKDPRDSDFLAGYDKLQAQMKGIYKSKSLAAQDELNRRFTVLGSEDRADVAYIAYRREKQLITDEIPATIQNYAMNGQRDLWQRDVDRFIENGVFTESQKQSLMMEYDKVESKLMKDAVKQNFSLQMNELAKTSGWDAVLEMITKPETRGELLKSGLTADDIDNEYENIRTLAQFGKANQEATYKSTVETVGQEVIKKINANDASALSFVDTSALNAEDKIKWRNRVIEESNRKAKAEPIVTNQQARYDLKSKALDIWRGTTSKTDFDTELNNARFGTMKGDKLVYQLGDIVSDKPLLSDSDYESLSNTAADTLKSSQAEAISRYRARARNVMVSVPDEMAFIDRVMNLRTKKEQDEATQQRQVELWYVGRYEDEILDWIRQNPNKLGKEFQQYAESLMHQYWNTSLEDKQKKKTEVEKKLLETQNATVEPRLEGETITQYLNRINQ